MKGRALEAARVEKAAHTFDRAEQKATRLDVDRRRLAASVVVSVEDDTQTTAGSFFANSNSLSR